MLCPAVGLAAEAPASAAAEDELPPELQAELDALQRQSWQTAGTLRGSVGWRDNVLLSPFAPIRRPFVRAEVEAIALRPRQAVWEIASFLNGDILRYVPAPAETSGEEQWAAHGEARWQRFAATRAALQATGYQHRQVLDLSETEAQRFVAPTTVRGANVGVTVTADLPFGLSLRPMLHLRRNDYREYPGDYDARRGGAQLEWHRNESFSIRAGWFETRRDYDERFRYTAGGRPLPGTRLKFHQRDADLRLRWTGGREHRVSASATVGRFENRDGASGYFDYDQERVRLELDWSRAAWRVAFDGTAKRLEFLGQTVGAGIAPPSRVADDYDVSLRLERQLESLWTAFLEHRWERSRSNEADFNYRANTALLGVQREF